MKKAVMVLLTVLGVLGLLVGVAGALIVGPDDVVSTPASSVELDGASAVVATPGVLALRGSHLEVSAQVPRGEVFVGRAHPIDIASYLSGRPTRQVTEVGLGGMTTTLAAGSPKAAPLVAPTATTFWTEHVTGPGRQTLRVPLDGTATQYVIVPLKGARNVEISTGLPVGGAFVLSVGIAVAGLLMALAGLVLLRRGRREKGSRAGACVTTAAAGPEVTPAPPGLWERSVGVAGGVALLLATAGCATLPERAAPWRLADLRKPAMTTAEVGPALTDYDRRNNAAIVRTHKELDPAAWAEADTGPLLDVDRWATAYEKATPPAKRERDSSGMEHAAVRSFLPEFPAYPMWFLVAADRRDKGTKAGASGGGPVVLMVMTRAAASDPWRNESTVVLPRAALPRDLAPGAPSTPTAAQRERARADASTVMSAVNNGTGLTLPAELASFRKDWAVSEKGVTRTLRADPYGSSRQTSPPPVDQVLRTVRTSSGTLSVLPLRVRYLALAEQEWNLWWPDPATATLLDEPGKRRSLSRTFLITVAFVRDARGLRIVGFDGDAVL